MKIKAQKMSNLEHNLCKLNQSEKQQSIVCAAVSEFAEKGLMATTMESVAKRAGVSKRTLYKHYSDKKALFNEVVAILINQFKRFENIEFDPNQAFRTQLEHIGQLTIALNRDVNFIKLFRIVIIESMRSKCVADALDEKFRGCELGLKNWFDAAHKSGALGKLDAQFVVNVFYGTLKKASFWDQAIKWHEPLSEQASHRLVQQTCDLIELMIANSKA